MVSPVSKKIDDEKRFQLLVEAVTDYAIYLLDPDGAIISWNSGAARLKGYSSAEVIGQNFSMFFTEEDRAAGVPMKALHTARDEGRYAADGWRVRKDGGRFWAGAAINPIRNDAGKLIGYALVTHEISPQREAQKMEAVGRLTGGIAHDFNNLLTVIVGSAELAELHVQKNEKLKRLIVNMRQAALRGKGLTKRLLALSLRDPQKPKTK